jgi:hypothetical protein
MELPDGLTWTAGGLAERIQRRGETINQANQRIRNWTKAGYLKPLADSVRPGIGHHRRYPLTAMYDALLLDQLTQSGMSGVRATALGDAFAVVRNWDAAEGLLLVVTGDKCDVVALSSLADWLRQNQADTPRVLIDLDRVNVWGAAAEDYKLMQEEEKLMQEEEKLMQEEEHGEDS